MTVIAGARRKLMGADAVPTHKLEVTTEARVKDEASKEAQEFLAQVGRFMGFADQIADRGLGSGKQQTDITGEARAVGIWVRDTSDEAIVEAEVVEEEAEPKIAGRWVDGRFIPDP